MNLDNLDWKEYGYVGQTKQRGGAISLRPQLRVTLESGGRSLATLGLMDSGGDYTLINADIAEVLGIDLSKCLEVEIGGVVGTGIKARLAKVQISLDSIEEDFDVEARFVEDMPIDVILGQHDFFTNFKVLFDREKLKFFLCRNHN